MGFVGDTLAGPRPDALAALDLPRRQHYHPSPENWQDEVVYFLLVDRFSNGAKSTPPLLDRAKWLLVAQTYSLTLSSTHLGRRSP
jgi:hypothetical protein